jgi:hypothetical protein
MKILCWLALLTILSACASKPINSSVSVEWDYIARAADRSSATYVEGASIRKLGDKVKLWEMLDYEEGRELGSKQVLSFKSLKEHDCKEKIYRGLSIIFYSKNMGKGAIVYSNNETRPWKSVITGSTNEASFKYACGGVK